MLPAVDAFLEKRQEYLDIGKTAIATALIPYENRDKLKIDPKDYHRYEYLFSKLDEPSLDKFRKNKIAFLSFNYDRSLKYFLFRAIKNTFALSDENTVSILDNFQ